MKKINAVLALSLVIAIIANAQSVDDVENGLSPSVNSVAAASTATREELIDRIFKTRYGSLELNKQRSKKVFG